MGGKGREKGGETEEERDIAIDFASRDHDTDNNQSLCFFIRTYGIVFPRVRPRTIYCVGGLELGAHRLVFVSLR